MERPCTKTDFDVAAVMPGLVRRFDRVRERQDQFFFVGTFSDPSFGRAGVAPTVAANRRSGDADHRTQVSVARNLLGRELIGIVILSLAPRPTFEKIVSSIDFFHPMISKGLKFRSETGNFIGTVHLRQVRIGI